MKGRVSSQFLTTASESAPLPSEAKSLLNRLVTYVQAVRGLHGGKLLGRVCVLSLLAWAPSTAVAYFMHVLFPAHSGPDIFSNAFQFFVGAVLVAPILETLSMRYVFRLTRKFDQRHFVMVLLSLVIWIPLHAMYAGWGLHAAWPFFILGLCYLSLESISLWRAMWVTALIHAVCNVLSYGLFLALNFFGLS